MTDFTSALKGGIAAAEAAEKNRNEIKSVFDELNNQIEVEFNKKIEIQIKERDVEKTFVEIMTALKQGKRRPTYFAITAWNPSVKGSPIKEIANWVSSSSGYPCTISFGSSILTSDDKESLEINLSTMLQDPTVGEKLYSLLKLEPKEDNPSEKPE